LPPISEAVKIDGYTQPGASENTNDTTLGLNSVLQIELSGANATTASGLVLDAGGSTVRGLVINGFANGSGIVIHSSGNIIQGDFVGTNAAGTSALPNGGGILARFGAAGSNNTIGGTAPAARNLSSGNVSVGITIEFTGNVVQGNLIGTDITGAV